MKDFRGKQAAGLVVSAGRQVVDLPFNQGSAERLVVEYREEAGGAVYRETLEPQAVEDRIAALQAGGQTEAAEDLAALRDACVGGG